MLVLSRKNGQAIRIADDIVITVVSLGRGRVQLGIDAPRNVRIHREEVLERMRDVIATETCDEPLVAAG